MSHLRIPYKHRSRIRATRARRGFSIIELLVAIIIIGILVAVLIPVVSSRTEQARIARVNADLQGLTEAMERVAVDTGYFVRLFALNDVLNGDGIGFQRNPAASSPRDTADGLSDYDNSVTQPFLQFATQNSLFIDPERGDFALGLTRADLIDRLRAAESTYDGSISWNGPYINWQKDSNVYNDGVNAGVPLRDGIPDDPWGNNYIFLTRVRSIDGTQVGGMLLEPVGEFIQTSVGPRSGGGFQAGGVYATDAFDRPTILSLGPNGLPGDGTGGVAGSVGTFGGGDDYYRQFGR